MSEMAEAIRQLMQEKGYSEDSVKTIITDALKAAYKRTYGTSENAIVTFSDDMTDVSIYSRKTVVDGVYDPVTEIELEDAQKLSSECEVGDEIDIPEDPKEFARSAVTTGKQTAHQGLIERYKDSLYSEYKDKIGEIVVCYHQYERNGDIYVDLGNAGKVEGKLPAKYQSPREHYEKNDRIKALIVSLNRPKTGPLQVILSRSDPELVRSIIEMEVPEIADGTIEIVKIVRDAGNRTKIAVSTNREDVDPVGACVGLKGVRIQNVIRELLGEKIDVLNYDSDPSVFIKNALSPATVQRVYILDQDKKQALAVVEDSQFSLAIGKQGQNVRLANRLCDWNIDVKTEEQAAEMDLSESVTMQTAQSLFNTDAENTYSEIDLLSELNGIDERVLACLLENGIENIEQFVEAYESNKLSDISNLSESDIDSVYAIIKDTVEFVEEDEVSSSEESESEEEYHCPECGALITLDMTHCPKCGVEFEFQEDEE
ncbi:MAG: transcription termination/antitermination protein NusA [Treponema sp.]|nr:transcription termination/antitermination protein NusA [Treponema sp.]